MRHPTRSEIQKGYTIARQITARHASSFYYASQFLSRRKQQAAYALYAICRLSDDTVDVSAHPERALARMEENITLAYGTTPLEAPLLMAFRDTIQTYAIPRQYFSELTEGMSMDLSRNRYLSFHELYDYCYKVAGIVGIVFLYVLSTPSPEAELYAVNLGIAMQLTNILRDIKEDALRGRIYLPQDELAQFGLTDQDITNHTVTEPFRAFMRFQINRARMYYTASEHGLDFIKEYRSRLVIRLMKDIYRQILSVIERRGYNVFGERLFVPWHEKTRCLLHIACRK